MMFLIICVTATVLLLAYMAPAILRFKQRYDFAQTVPGPSFMEMRKLAKCGCKMLLFIFNFVFGTFGNPLLIDSFLAFIKFLEICRQRYGPVIRLWQGFDLAVLFFDAEDIKVGKPSDLFAIGIGKLNFRSYIGHRQQHNVD